MPKPTTNHPQHHIFVCQNCKTGEAMLQKLKEYFGKDKNLKLHPTRCTGGCTAREKGQGYASIATAAEGKDSCLFNHFKPEDEDMTLFADFLKQYTTHPDGRIRLKNMTHPRADEKYFLARLPHLPKKEEA